MKRNFSIFAVTDFLNIKDKVLGYLQESGTFCFLDNHEYNFDKTYECLAACGIIKSFTPDNDFKKFTDINLFEAAKQDWLFGHISYDVKNEFEELQSSHLDKICFPDFFFFIPEVVFILSKNEIRIGVYEGNDAQKIYNAIISNKKKRSEKQSFLSLTKKITKEDYIGTVKKLQEHIQRGDCYEINFCQEIFAEKALINPLQIYKKLSALSPNPFSAFYRINDSYLFCASPERFLKKVNDTIISQPIKGTAKRYADKEHDNNEKEQLLNSEKERAENIMIVDLVRNDLSKICEEGSVTVKDFLKIFSFPQVHQMISTIEGRLRKDISFVAIIAATFPMASMTGAPKKKVMELIEKYETTRRGLFSGTVGYINPEGDFDFNVVIRSIFYNKKNRYLSMQAGSAITSKSVPEQEYEECLVKLDALIQTLK